MWTVLQSGVWCLHIQMHTCGVFSPHTCDLGWNHLGKAQADRERLTNINFWRSRLQSRSHLVPAPYAVCNTEEGLSKLLLGLLEFSLYKAGKHRTRRTPLAVALPLDFLPFFTESLLPPSGFSRYL